MSSQLRPSEHAAPAILIVEDEAIVAKDLQQTLTEQGYDAFAIAASAEDALARAERRQPDLVLMDIRIKGELDGIAAATALRERYGTPVIYLTAYADDATIERAKSSEPSGYLLKPIRSAELKSSIEIALYRRMVEEERRRRAERARSAEMSAQGSQRLRSLETMAAGMAHELNNPLTVVVVNAELVANELKRRLGLERQHAALLRREAERELEQLVEAQLELQSAAGNIARVVSNIRSFRARSQSSGSETDAGLVLRQVVAAARATARERARLIEQLEPVPKVGLPANALEEVLTQLLKNALDAIAPGAAEANEVRVCVRPEADDQVAITVSDSGSGMPEAVLQRIFEPYFTTKPLGSGSGLGLWTCHRIVRAAGGRLSAASQPGRGSVFSLFLPIAAVRLAPPAAAGELVATSRKGRLLVIDDEPMLLRSIRRMLPEHDVVCVESAREGLGLLAANESFDLIVSDLMMPGMSGVEFYEELRRRRPEDARRIVFVTGGALGEDVDEFLGSVPNARLEKPFVADDLRRTVRDLLGR